MNINITARHATLTPEIRKYCERRIQSIEKLVGHPVEADMILSIEKYRHRAEINVKTKGATLNTIGETQDMFSALGVAFDHIEKRVKKERDKLRERKRRRTREAEMYPPAPETAEQPKRIIPSRNTSPKPLSIEEAALQLESSRKEILVFRKSDSEKWAVLFRRKDGHLGLIEPE